MGYLLDTNVISELRKGARCDSQVAAWRSQVRPMELFLSVITLGEIRRGIEQARKRNPASAGGIEQWLTNLEHHFPDRVLPVTAAIADRWGRLVAEQTLPVLDTLIAATAIEHKLSVVTRNTVDFSRCGVSLINPFSPDHP